jgi:hypothetical protein
MSGLGDSPIGLSTPFGVGVAIEAVAPPTLAPQAARFVDPVTRDYALESDGSYQRMPELRQRVLLAITESRGSSSVRPHDGTEVPDRIDASFERRMKSSIARSLSFLVASGALRVDGITLEYPNTGRTETTVAYTDLKTGARDTAKA